jgi:hypothetical protein
VCAEAPSLPEPWPGRGVLPAFIPFIPSILANRFSNENPPLPLRRNLRQAGQPGGTLGVGDEAGEEAVPGEGDQVTAGKAQGLRVTINSDDPAYFGGYVGRNYLDTARALGLSRTELATLARNSLLASFVTDAERAPWLARLDALSTQE